MASPEGKLPESRWSFSALNFPNSGYFHKIFGLHLQKGLVYLYTKKFLPMLLHFWNYDLSPNGQVISLIFAQAHSKTSSWGLSGTKYWRLFIVEYLQPDKFKEKPSFNPIYQVSCFSSLGNESCFHVFPEKDHLSRPAQGKKIMFSEEKYHLSR